MGSVVKLALISPLGLWEAVRWYILTTLFILHKNYSIIILSSLSTQFFNIGNSDYTKTEKFLIDKPLETRNKL